MLLFFVMQNSKIDLWRILFLSACTFILDDVIKWKHFPRYWPFVRGIYRSAVNCPHKDQWRGALMFSLICAWINGWANNRDAGDLRRHRVHYGVTVATTFMDTSRLTHTRIHRHTYINWVTILQKTKRPSQSKIINDGPIWDEPLKTQEITAYANNFVGNEVCPFQQIKSLPIISIPPEVFTD